MDVETQGATTTDSPTVTEPAAAPSQATTQPAQNGDQNGDNVPFHQHPRWKQVMGELQQLRPLRTEYQRLQQELQQLRAGQQQVGQRQPTPEQQQALQALRELQALDPESSKLQQRIDQLERTLQGFEQRQQTVLTTQGMNQLGEMARESGLPTDPKSLRVIENAVTVYLADNPEAVQRFRNHDLSVIKDAFKEFNDNFLGKMRRESVARVAETKQAAAAIPTPAKNGAPPGPSAPPKVTAANESDVRAGMRERFRSLLMGGDTE